MDAMKAAVVVAMAVKLRLGNCCNKGICGFKISRCIDNSVCVFCRTHKPESCAPLSTLSATLSQVIYLAVGSLPGSDQADRTT
jgi:hypothetical protein